MKRIIVAVLLVSLLIACDKKADDSFSVSGVNHASLTFCDQPTPEEIKFGPGHPGTAVECQRDKDGHILVAAYRFADNNRTQIEEAWQFYEDDPEQSIRFHFEIDEKPGDPFPPFVYFSSAKFYETNPTAPCRIVYQRKDEWLAGIIVCDALQSTAGVALVTGKFQCRPYGTIGFQVDQITFQKLKARPESQ